MILNASKYNNSWPERSLSDLGTFSRGKSRHRPRNDIKLFQSGIYPLIQTGDVKAAHLYITKHEATYNDFGLAQSKLWPQDTLCITIAANIAETALLKYPMCFPDSVVGFNADPERSSELFMHYVFTFVRRTIQRSTSGSIQDNINIDFLTDMKLKIPNKPVQDDIANTLSAIDKKIEANLEINIQLESIVRVLYDYWFMQFDFPGSSKKPYRSSGGKFVYDESLKQDIPEDWSCMKLKDILEFQKGSEPGAAAYSEQNKEGYVKFYRVGDVGRIGETYVDSRTSGLVTTEYNDVVVTLDGSIGKIGLCFDGAISSGLRKVFDKSGTLHSSLVWAIFLDPRVQLTMERFSTGSILMHASDSINYLQLPYRESVFVEFQRIIDPLFEQVIANSAENQKLIDLRDWLLPMLMTGQVKITG
jgi:type I restriction enzyme S subunit